MYFFKFILNPDYSFLEVNKYCTDVDDGDNVVNGATLSGAASDPLSSLIAELFFPKVFCQSIPVHCHSASGQLKLLVNRMRVI